MGTEVPAGYTFSLVLPLMYKDNYATADKTKHMLCAPQRRRCHVSKPWVGCFVLHVRLPPGTSLINDNAQPSGNVEISTHGGE